MKVLVLGATGGTGRLIVRDALAKGHSVAALVRSKARALGVCSAAGRRRDKPCLRMDMFGRDDDRRVPRVR